MVKREFTALKYPLLFVFLVLVSSVSVVYVLNNMLASSGSGTVEVVVENDAVGGSAFVQFFMAYPDGVLVKTRVKEPGKTLVMRVDVSEAIRSWERFYAGHKSVGAGSLTLPTFSIVIYRFGADGEVYISSTSFNPVKYLAKKFLSLSKAVSVLSKDPLAPFREPIKVRVERVEWVIVKLPKHVHHGTVGTRTAASTYSYRAPSSARTVLEEVEFTELYNARNTPTKTWLSHVSGVDDEAKHLLWRWFAEKMSKRYYLPYTDEDAVHMWIERNLIPPGLYSMDQFLRAIASKLGLSKTPAWINTVAGRRQFEYVPVLGVTAVWRVNADIAITFGIVGGVGGVYYHGVSILGTVTYPIASTMPLESEWPPLTFMPRYENVTKYIMVPTTFKYVADGIFITYEVYKVNRTDPATGCVYSYMVVPRFTPVPIYMQTSFDIKHSFTITVKPSSPEPVAEYLKYVHVKPVTVFDETVTALPGETIFADTSNINENTTLTVSIVSLGLTSTLVDTVMTILPQTVAITVSSPLLKTLLSYTVIGVSGDTQILKIQLAIGANSAVKNTKLKVTKLTLQTIGYDPNKTGWTTLTTKYTVEIDNNMNTKRW